MKKAFTLIELLVVVGIIGILIAALAVGIGGSTESARSAKCLTNLRNLSQAVSSYTMVNGVYPLAGTREVYTIVRGTSGSKLSKIYSESVGWVSWDSRSAGYEGKPTAERRGGCTSISAYCQDQEQREYCLTNGALWKYVAGNRDVFVCPAHRRAKPNKLDPVWSYVMNGWFGYDRDHKSYPGAGALLQENMSRADRRLLFAELPWREPPENMKSLIEPVISESPNERCDCVLQMHENGGNPTGESIGFNHIEGRDYIAHVVFVDGHVEKLRFQKSTAEKTQVERLTGYLTTGRDYYFVNGKFEQRK